MNKPHENSTRLQDCVFDRVFFQSYKPGLSETKFYTL